MTDVSAREPAMVTMLYYDDVAVAQEWLSSVFGLVASARHTDAEGMVVGAEMHMGSGRVMLLGGADSQHGMRSPRQDGSMTGGVYVALDDVDAQYEQSQAAGATIVLPLQDMPYGSREYGALDVEGHYWSFGTYRPE
jgi:uncharacterized glyoxalase superfamily protein PhnB